MWRRVNTNRGVWPCARVGREGYGWAGRSTMTQGCLSCPGSGQRTSPAKRFLPWDYQVKACFPNRWEIDITIFRYFCVEVQPFHLSLKSPFIPSMTTGRCLILSLLTYCLVEALRDSFCQQGTSFAVQGTMLLCNRDAFFARHVICSIWCTCRWIGA